MDVEHRQSYEKALNCNFPCSITSLLAMNCRAKAEGVVRRFGHHSRHNVTDQPTASDMHPLTDFCADSIEDMKSNQSCGHDAKLISELFDIEGMRPIHVVTSEPTLHLCLPRTRHNTQTSHSDPEQDSDMYYDFDMATPEDGSRSRCSSSGALCGSSYNGSKVKYSRMEEDGDSKGVESGCVTSVGSPILFSQHSPSSNQPSPDKSSSLDEIKPSSNIDLTAVRNILTSSFQLSFKSFSDEDCNTKVDIHSFPYIFKNRHYKKERRRNKPLKYKCPICHDNDKHHSYLCQVRNSGSNKEQDAKTDSKTYPRKEIKKRRIKNKLYRKNRSDHIVKSSSSESLESSDTSPINTFSSPTATRHSGNRGQEDMSIKQIQQQDPSSPGDIADIMLATCTHSQQGGYPTRDNDVTPISLDTGHVCRTVGDLGDGYNITKEPSLKSFCRDNAHSDDFNLYFNDYDKFGDVTQSGESSLSNEVKNVFDMQKAKHMDKFYKSLERKLPTKDMTYVDIEISDGNSSKSDVSRAYTSNAAILNSSRDCEGGIEDGAQVPSIHTFTNQAPNSSDEQVAANSSQRYAKSGSSHNEVASDNVRCAVASHGYALKEATSSFRDYSSFDCDYNYSSPPDANLYLCDSNVTYRPVMPKTEGQAKVKKSAPKTRTNGVLGNELRKNVAENDTVGEDQCPDSELRITEIDANGDNHIIDKDDDVVTCASTDVSGLSENLIKGTVPTLECNNSDNKSCSDVNSSKLSEIDSSQVSVRPKTYFNRSRKGCKNQYSSPSNFSNGCKIDSQPYIELGYSINKSSPERDNSIETLRNEELDVNATIDDNPISKCQSATIDSFPRKIEDIFDEEENNLFNPSRSKYYDESCIEEKLNDCLEIDEIETLPENEDNNDCVQAELDEDDIILTGKFKNVINYSEKVTKVSEEDKKYQYAPTQIILIDDSNLPNNDETKSMPQNKGEISDTQLLSELTQLKLKDEHLLDTIDVEIQPPSDDSARSSCERDSSDGDEFKNRIKRSSSLKCGKTPPGTPGRKKIVRFADVLGLDLADVRTFLEGIPDVPKSAFCDLQVEEEAAASLSGHHGTTVSMAVSRRILTAMFQQPGSLPDFIDRVRYHKVSLENVTIGDDLSVRGIVRVYNMDFQKSVYVRYTFDHWRNNHEAQASYVKGSSDGFSDRFSFLLWGSFLQCNGALVFCIRYCTKGQQYWDNNLGSNYVLQCYPAPVAGRGLEGRPQNDTSVQQTEKMGSGGRRSFMETPTTPPDPWTNRFF